jgi:hypothetical protein
LGEKSAEAEKQRLKSIDILSLTNFANEIFSDHNSVCSTVPVFDLPGSGDEKEGDHRKGSVKKADSFDSLSDKRAHLAGSPSRVSLSKEKPTGHLHELKLSETAASASSTSVGDKTKSHQESAHVVFHSLARKYFTHVYRGGDGSDLMIDNLTDLRAMCLKYKTLCQSIGYSSGVQAWLAVSTIIEATQKRMSRQILELEKIKSEGRSSSGDSVISAKTLPFLGVGGGEQDAHFGSVFDELSGVHEGEDGIVVVDEESPGDISESEMLSDEWYVASVLGFKETDDSLWTVLDNRSPGRFSLEDKFGTDNRGDDHVFAVDEKTGHVRDPRVIPGGQFWKRFRETLPRESRSSASDSEECSSTMGAILRECDERKATDDRTGRKKSAKDEIETSIEKMIALVKNCIEVTVEQGDIESGVAMHLLFLRANSHKINARFLRDDHAQEDDVVYTSELVLNCIDQLSFRGLLKQSVGLFAFASAILRNHDCTEAKLNCEMLARAFTSPSLLSPYEMNLQRRCANCTYYARSSDCLKICQARGAAASARDAECAHCSAALSTDPMSDERIAFEEGDCDDCDTTALQWTDWRRRTLLLWCNLCGHGSHYECAIREWDKCVRKTERVYECPLPRCTHKCELTFYRMWCGYDECPA